MNDMEYITQKLTELGWKNYSGEFHSKDGRFKADIDYYNDDHYYEVRVALVGIFDRWANSGVEVKFASKERVISFFEKDEYMSVAFSEVTNIIRENISDSKTKDFLYELIDKSAKWFNEV